MTNEEINIKSLLIKFIQKATTEEESVRVQQWMEQNEENANLFLRIKQLYETGADKDYISKDKIGVEWQRISSRISNNKSRKVSISRMMKVAAVAVILLTTGTILLWQSTLNKKHVESIVNMIEVHAERGERKVFDLPDGTRVSLNSESSIIYPEKFMPNQRNLELFGEGFFEVQEDPSRPFTVTTNEIITTVLGTKFNILEENNNVTISVISGKVKVKSLKSKGQIILSKNEQLSYFLNDRRFVRKQVNADVIRDWSRGVIHFDNIFLQEAFIELEKWFNVKIECNSQGLLNSIVQARYQNKDLMFILRDLEFMYELDYMFKNDSTITVRD